MRVGLAVRPRQQQRLCGRQQARYMLGPKRRDMLQQRSCAPAMLLE